MIFDPPQYDPRRTSRIPIQDPLDWSELEQTDTMELDYATSTMRELDVGATALWILILPSILGALASLALQPLGPHFGHHNLLPIFIFIGFLMGISSLMRGNLRLSFVIGPAIVLVVGWIAFQLSTTTVMFFSVTLFLAALLADQVTTHYIYWRTVPPVPLGEARRVRSFWDRRHWFFSGSAAEPRTPSNLHFIYPLQLAAVIVGTPLVILWARYYLGQTSSYAAFARPLSLLVGCSYLLAIPLCLSLLQGVLSGGRGGDSLASHPVSMLTGTWAAIRSYLTYNAHQVRAPGVFYSPAGLFPFRAITTMLCIGFLGATISPLADYFPTRWPEAEAFDFRLAFSIEPEIDPDSPLEPNEQITLHKMKSDGATREELIAALRRWGHDDAEELVPESRGLTAFPGNWILYAIRDVAHGDTWALIPIMVSSVLCVLAPSAFFFVVCVSLGGLYSGGASETSQPLRLVDEGSRPVEHAASSRWNAIVDRLTYSRNEEERKHIYIGRNYWSDAPVLIPQELLQSHAHILGDSGSGKTSLGLVPLVTQLIRNGDASVVIFDLKGSPKDRALFESVREECEHPHGGGDPISFKFFNSRLGWPTHLFNPLLTSPSVPLSIYQRAEILCQAMGLIHGRGYGEGWFSDANAALGYAVLKTFPEIQTFREFGEEVRKILSTAKSKRQPNRDMGDLPPEIHKGANHIWAVLNRLGDLDVINWVPEREDPKLVEAAIDFETLFDRNKPREVLYFEFPGAIAGESSSEIARLAFYRLLERSEVPGKTRQVFAIIDEFQQVAAFNFTRILELARSAGIGLILSNQTLGALQRKDPGLAAAVESNTQFKQVFAVGGIEEAEHWCRASGIYLDHEYTQTYHHDSMGVVKGSSFNVRETAIPRFSYNDLKVMSAKRQRNLILVGRNMGFARYDGMPLMIETDYHIDKHTYNDRKEAGIPEAGPGTVIVGEFRARGSERAGATESKPATEEKEDSVERGRRGVHILGEELKKVRRRK